MSVVDKGSLLQSCTMTLSKFDPDRIYATIKGVSDTI